MNSCLSEFLRLLKLTPTLPSQQYRTLRGQAIHGDIAGAEKGYARLMIQRRVPCGNRKNKGGAAQPRRV